MPCTAKRAWFQGKAAEVSLIRFNRFASQNNHPTKWPPETTPTYLTYLPSPFFPHLPKPIPPANHPTWSKVCCAKGDSQPSAPKKLPKSSPSRITEDNSPNKLLTSETRAKPFFLSTTGEWFTGDFKKGLFGPSLEKRLNQEIREVLLWNVIVGANSSD